MVVIRLARGGAKKRPFYNMVVTDSRNRRDGRFVERVGFYNPVASGNAEGLVIKMDRLTPSMDATPCADARGSANARPPLAPKQGHPLHSCASRTVIDTSLNHQPMADKPLVSSKAAASCPHEEIIELYHQILPTGRRVVVTVGGDAGDGSGARRWGLNTNHGWTLALTDADVAPGDVEGCVGAIG